MMDNLQKFRVIKRTLLWVKIGAVIIAAALILQVLGVGV